MTEAVADKPKRAKKPTPNTGEAVLSSFQKFTSVTVHRRQLKNAPYNPRNISDEAKEKLRKGIETVGLIEAITWNVRSGNIVGGHRRSAILDALEGSDNYLLTVNQVDMAEAEEIEANILLNNQEAQGEYDIEKLSELFANKAVRVEATGFSAADLYQLFGDDPNIVTRGSVVDELSNKVRDAAEQVRRIAETATNRDGTGFYIVVVFKDEATVEKFQQALGLDDNRFQDGRKLQALLVKDAEKAST